MNRVNRTCTGFVRRVMSMQYGAFKRCTLHADGAFNSVDGVACHLMQR